jgi:hypothetical protein
MNASKRTVSGDDQNLNLSEGCKTTERGGPEHETLNVDIVTPALRFMRSKASNTQQNRGEGMAAGEEGRS